MLKVGVITLFPEMFDLFTDWGISARAVDRGLVQLALFNPRDHAEDAYRTVDDRPYGGGPGMVMMYRPLRRSIQDARAVLPGAPVLLLTPQGQRLDQAQVQSLSRMESLILVAGRYEGLDERLIEAEVDQQWSVGDYVLSGGELACLVLLDAVTRLLPGSLGHAGSAADDSFAQGLLEHPQYTRPDEVDGRRVPEILLCGNHGAIRRWRMKQALGRTWLRRPDLLERHPLNVDQKQLLDEFIAEQHQGRP